jgi:LacI family transcriptional regulator
MKDVAREAGVSIGTVDRVLHDRGRYSETTAIRVRDAAERLQFHPNLVASNLKKSQWRTLTALLPHPEQDGGFWEMVVDGINRAIEELGHHYVRVRFAHYDRFRPETFEAIATEIGASVENAEAENAGVILAPTLQSASSRFARQIGSIPIVVLDGELPDVDLLCTISQESYEGGLLAGKLLHLVSGSGRYASVVVGREDYHLNRRREGFEEYFDRRATTERLEADCDEDLIAIVRERIRRLPTIDGVFVTNAAAHLVIQSIIAETGTERALPPIVGYDLLAENIAHLENGSLSFVINQQPENQGYRAVYALYRNVVLGEEVEQQIRIPVDLVTRETLRFHSIPRIGTKG